jgi:allantoinase
MALERHPELTAAFVELGHEIACHGWRWIHYQNIDEATEREHMRIGMEIIEQLTGERPAGLVHRPRQPQHPPPGGRHGGFCTTATTTATTCPSGCRCEDRRQPGVPHLVVPYTLDTNDMRFALPQGFSHGDEFFEYLRDAFDVHYAEGDERPAMMSIGMHCRLLGRPGASGAAALPRPRRAHDRVWVCRRVDIARHWKQVHPFDRRHRLRLCMGPGMLTLEQINAADQARVHRAAGRHLRTFAVDRRGGLGAAALRQRWRS